ncbi:hypothetical protein GFM13_11705 [Rhizobium leguminosarum bv. viciae]|nr:hypothetical protein [Rhizobium leguminosarum bv. viciae]
MPASYSVSAISVILIVTLKSTDSGWLAAALVVQAAIYFCAAAIGGHIRARVGCVLIVKLD